MKRLAFLSILLILCVTAACMRPDAKTAMPEDIETWKGKFIGRDQGAEVSASSKTFQADMTFILTRMPIGDGKDVEGVLQLAVSASPGGAGPCRFDVKGRLDDDVLKAGGNGSCSLAGDGARAMRIEMDGTMSGDQTYGSWTLNSEGRKLLGRWKARRVE